MAKVAHRVSVLEVDADGPDVFGREWRLLPNQRPLVPSFRMFTGP